MFGDIEQALRRDLLDRDYAEEYASAFLNSFVATQIKVIREQRGMTQAELGSKIGTTQGGVSRYEDVNYSSWTMRTLMKLAHAFDVRLRISFEPYGTLPDEVIRLDRSRLETVERANDPDLTDRSTAENERPDVTDIGAYKALAQIGERPGRPATKDEGKKEAYGSDRSNEGARADDDRAGRPFEPRQDTSVGLYSAIGSAV